MPRRNKLAAVVFLLLSGIAPASADPYIPFIRPAFFQTPESDCGTMREDEPGGSMERVPVLDQGSASNCYAQVTAQMVDAWRFTKGPVPPFGPQPPAGGFNHYTSANQLTQDMNDEAGFDTTATDNLIDQLTWQRPGKALRVLKSHRSCSARHLFGDDNPISESNAENELTSLKAIFYIHADYNRRHPEELQALLRDAQRDFADRPDELKFDEVFFRQAQLKSEDYQLCRSLQLTGFNDRTLEESFGRDMLGNLAALVGFSRGQDDFINRLRKWVCDRHSVDVNWLPNMHEQITLIDPMLARKEVQSRLNRPHPQPVMVGFCSSVLYDPGYRGENLFKACDNTAQGVTDRHFALVIGRRWNASAGKCQLLVRSSYGADCSGYEATTPHWDCARKNGVDTGSVWVDEEALLRNTYTVGGLGD